MAEPRPFTPARLLAIRSEAIDRMLEHFGDCSPDTPDLVKKYCFFEHALMRGSEGMEERFGAKEAEPKLKVIRGGQ